MRDDDPRHGTNAGYRAHYNHGVPLCQPCRDAHADYARDRRTRLYLTQSDQLYVPVVGIERRIRALQALGWNLAAIGRAMGYDIEADQPIRVRVWNITSRQVVRADTAQRVRAAYAALSMTPGPSSSARALARRKGWPPPLAWDDIDDPDEKPQGMKAPHRSGRRTSIDHALVERALVGDWSLIHGCTTAERVEIARRWHLRGGSMQELERLTGWKPERYHKTGTAA